ncbi:arylsulfatase A-like enzyme [Catalinimonas alkaloidigena]|uniref:sulfatase family protein n=1 Tax=Catalinimonas alkaloidigena TaxID=1075417 RepID=UPI002406C939|nr:sulfatase [Catalinimonas alkaloidigena]MDF9796949.1 arylsulfatase A-like enzyme [Catalinimonas alkaloidigena]
MLSFKQILFFLLCTLVVNVVIAQNTKSSLPNIVLIYADDLGYGDLGTYGALQFQTPNLDKLAAEGMRFTNFEVAQAVCSASRAAILTGCYSNRVGIGGALNPHAKIGLNPEEETIAELVKRAGDYSTAMYGKWHLGHLKPFLPSQQGFDEYVGVPYSNDMWKWTYDMQLATEETHARKASYPELPLMAGDTVFKTIEDLEDQAELTTIYTERAVEFINNNKDNPFLLCVPHSMPHVPLAVSDKFKGKSEQGLYGDVIMEIDWSVGEIMKALDQHNLTENTLVIFTSDNGPWLNFGDHAGSTGGLREGKGTSFEGGQRVPCIMRWPAQIPGGSICNQLASTIDLLPTFADMVGVSLPDKKIDGVSILPLMKAEKDAKPRDIFYYYYQGNALEAVRRDHWKLVFPHVHRSYEGLVPGQGGVYGDTRQVKTELALYDLRRDPGERYDVQHTFPEIVEELKQIADEARADLGDKLQNVEGKNVREPGRISSP